jgi:DNA (cytosine-5)-methyltransferase 1
VFKPGLLLSLFPGADLLGRGFEGEGFDVVRGPDALYGQDVRGWRPARHVFEGIFGGSPCQDFSTARRGIPPTGEGLELLAEFALCVAWAEPDWFLLENVPGVPSVAIEGYTVQRFNLNAKECGVAQNRLRTFQFGSRDGKPLVIPRSLPSRGVSRCAMATEGKREDRRTWADFCELQGLPRDFDLPGLPRALKYKMVGNGVPVPMASVIARAIKVRSVTAMTRLCICECGREVAAGRTMATDACRKRMQRRRDAAGSVTDRVVTVPGQSHFGVTEMELL